jgi:hypothetical protein
MLSSDYLFRLPRYSGVLISLGSQSEMMRWMWSLITTVNEYGKGNMVTWLRIPTATRDRLALGKIRE